MLLFPNNLKSSLLVVCSTVGDTHNINDIRKCKYKSSPISSDEKEESDEDDVKETDLPFNSKGIYLLLDFIPS
jgi:hypothetical protein